MGVQTSSIVFWPADSAATKGRTDTDARTRTPATLTALRKPAYIIGFSSAGRLCGSVAFDFSIAPFPSAADRRRHRARRIPICLSPSLLPLPPSTTVGNFSCNLWIFCCTMKKRRERKGEQGG